VKGIDHPHSVGDVDLKSSAIAESWAIANNQSFLIGWSTDSIKSLRNWGSIDITSARFCLWGCIERPVILYEFLYRNERVQAFESGFFERISQKFKDVCTLATASRSQDKENVFVFNKFPGIVGFVDQSLQLKDIDGENSRFECTNIFIDFFRSLIRCHFFENF
jgi:hypothetical protein